MRLTVRVIEARNLRAMDSNGFSDPYVKLQLGKQRFKTKVIKMNLNPTWDQEFSFLVRDVKDVLKIDVYDEDILQMDDFLGQLRVPLEDVLAADDLSLGTRWYQLLPKGKTNKTFDCGEIYVSISLESSGASRSWSEDLGAEVTDIQRGYSLSSQSTAPSIAFAYRETETCKEDDECSVRSEILSEDRSSEFTDTNQAAAEDKPNGNSSAALNGTETSSGKTDKSDKLSFVDRVCQIFAKKNGDTVPTSSESSEALEEVQEEASESELSASQTDNVCPETPFSELLKSLESRHEGVEMQGRYSS